MLSTRSDLVELYVQGAKLETLRAEAVCEGAPLIRDAVIIPPSAFEHLVSRLMTAADAPEMNRSLFEFLASRASDAVVLACLEANSGLIRREALHYWRIGSDGRLRFLARVHRLHRLPEEIRLGVAHELQRIALQDLDSSFLDNDDILGLLKPMQLLRLGVQLVNALDGVVPNRILEITEEADLNSDIPDQFYQVRSFVEQLQEAFSNDEAVQDRLQSLRGKIDDAIAELSEKQNQDKDVGSWSDVSPAKVAAALKGRSIFSDIDE